MRSADHFRSAAVLAFAIGIGGCSQPHALYVTPQHKDLGVIDKDSHVAVAEFEIVNGLDQLVEIKHIYPSCKCTTIELLENPIPAGKSTVLRATADLSKQKGKQDFTVTLLTDNPEFSEFRLSFSALVPVTGDSYRHFSIGSFYPDSAIDVELPTASFSQGLVEPLDPQGPADSLDIATRLSETSEGGMSLVVKGTAPKTPGAFSRKIRFRESIPDKPALGEGVVELDLMGQVVARWDVKRDIYCGFISLKKDGDIISLLVKSNPSTQSPTKYVSRVSVEFSEDWVSLQSHALSSDGIAMELKVHEGNLKHMGAVDSLASFLIEYDDGASEKYPAHLYAHIDH